MKLRTSVCALLLFFAALFAVACSARKTGETCNVGKTNSCGACWPEIHDLGGSCIALNGCAGTRVCSADGTAAECRTAQQANACGVCGGGEVRDVGASCKNELGASGVLVCNDKGNGTVCAATVVTLTFDDTFADTLDAVPMLEAHGMRGVFYVNSPRLTRNAHYMTLPQVLDLQRRGHEIGGHTLDHVHLPTLTEEAQRAEICNDRASLLSMGLDVRHFAYPFGQADAVTESVAESCNYNSARGVGNLRDEQGHALVSESFVPPKPFHIRADSSIRTENTLEEMKQRVVAGEAGGGGWVIINMHHVCDTCGTNQVHPDILKAFLDWFEPHAAENLTYVRTVRQMIRGDAKPPVVASGAVTLDAGTPGMESLRFGSVHSASESRSFDACEDE